MTPIEWLLAGVVVVLAMALLRLQGLRHRREDRDAEGMGQQFVRAMANFEHEINSFEHDCRCLQCGTVERNVVFSITSRDKEHWPRCCGRRMVVMAKERTDADV